MLLPTSTIHADTVHEKLIKSSNIKANGEYMRSRFLSLMKVPFDEGNKSKKALIIGDSYAQDFYNSVFEGRYLKNYQIRTRYIPVRCQIFLGDEFARAIKPRDKTFCDQVDSLQKAKQQITKADLIIFVGSWKDWSAKHLPQTIKNMALHSQQKLIVIGKKSYGRVAIKKYLAMTEDDLKQLRNPVDAGQMETNQILKNSLDEGMFIDQHEMVCGKQETCPLFTDQMELISFDGGHLTKEGARYTGQILFQNPILKSL
ncbi:MAG: SGNH hydrolase domain-containing protein [Cocleimonas sp.]